METRTVRMSLGTALVVVAVLAVGRSQAPEPQRLELIETSVTRVAPGPGLLTWHPSALPGAGQPLDLCDDADAVLAGLDGGALAQDRIALGVACDEDTIAAGIRYAVVGQSGAVHLLTADELAAADIGRLTTGEDRDTPVAPADGTALVLGQLGGSVTGGGAPTDAVHVVTGSVSTSDAEIRGLLENTSDRFARSIRIDVRAADGALVAEGAVSLTAQAGEQVPFEVAIPERLEADTLVVTASATFTDEPPFERAFLAAASPGQWIGPAEEFPGIPALRAGMPDGPMVSYYETYVEVVTPASHPSVGDRLEARGVAAPFAVVAYMDGQRRVLDVEAVDVFASSRGDALVDQMRLGDTASLGFFLPPEAEAFALWVSGGDVR